MARPAAGDVDGAGVGVGVGVGAAVGLGVVEESWLGEELGPGVTPAEQPATMSTERGTERRVARIARGSQQIRWGRQTGNRRLRPTCGSRGTGLRVAWHARGDRTGAEGPAQRGEMGKKHRHDARLTVGRTEDVPLREVSGICLRRGPNGTMQVVAIGDRAAVGAWTLVPDQPGGPLAWQTAPLTGLTGTRIPADDPQIEAVCADGTGRVLLLQESPARVELVDPPVGRVIAGIDLQVPAGHPLAASWADPDGSRGEGAAFMANGHLLVAKEKDPPALIEFGPAGATATGFRAAATEGGAALPGGSSWPVEPGEQSFVLLAAWTPDRALARACRDLSDLEVGPDGRLYVLSDRSQSVARLGDLDPADPVARAEATWELPHLDGKPEGLAFTPGGRAMVALDTKEPRRNLVLLDPAIAPPSAAPRPPASPRRRA